MIPEADLWRFSVKASGRKSVLPRAVTSFTIKNSLDSMLVHEDDNRIVLSIAGTQGTIPDWCENGRALPNRDGIHSGYAEAAHNFLSPDFVDYLKGAEHRTIEGTGHSQGAGQICAVAYYARKEYGISIPCIVHFGGPPWGLKVAVEYLNRACSVTRVVTPNDPVELRWTGLLREGRRQLVDGCRAGRLIGAFDHDYPIYTRGIRELCRERGDNDGVAAMNMLLVGQSE